MSVGQYTGDMKVGKWTQEKWELEFKKTHILVMIARVFLDLILQGKITFRNVNLLVFDECHHAVKDHDYVEIMRRYKDYFDPLQPTHFLGLTASLIPSKCKPGDLILKIGELEKTLCCRAQTARDLTEVAKYATNPDEVCKYFTPSSKDSSVCRLRVQLEETLDFLEDFPRRKRDSKIYGMVKMNLEDCFHILVSLGIWCANSFARRAIDEISELIADCENYFDSDEDRVLIHLGHTKLKLFEKDSSSLSVDKFNRLHMTDKVHQLLLLFADATVTVDGSPQHRTMRGRESMRSIAGNLHGIIFTERRTTTTVLKELICKLSKERLDLQYIKCDCVVGHNDSNVGTVIRREARMNVKKLEGVLSKFRKGQINLLVSTSVVEEGVDVAKCNLVIRFDFPLSFRSYVQSKGRARAKDSQYILLIPFDEREKMMIQLEDYNGLVKELERVCHNRHVADDQEILDKLKDEVEPYRRGNATATINSAMFLVHK